MGVVLGTRPHTIIASQATYGTNCPVWEEAFRFFLQDPRSQELDVQVRATSFFLSPQTLLVHFVPYVVCVGGCYFSGTIEGTEGHTDALQMLYQMNSLKFLSGIHSLGRLSPLTPSVHVQTKTLQVLELCSVQEVSFTMFKLLQLKIFIRLKFCLD